jgi:hypothetical protein
MKPQLARVILGILALGYLMLYAFVLFVAIATTGDQLVRSPGAWYAALAPPLYVALAGAYAFRRITRPLPTAALIALHIAIIPALAVSFLGLGLLLPLFSLLWWLMSRESPGAMG